MPNDVNENLRTAYRELCTSYRAIDDFRAKLLGFLPLASGTGIFLLLEKVKEIDQLKEGAAVLLLVIGSFGILITSGLFLYEIYGIKKCGALVQAGTRMEKLMGIDDGQFGSRPPTVARRINEPLAAGVIYPAVLAAWVFFALYFTAPTAKTPISIVVFLIGLIGTAIYDGILRAKAPRESGRCD